MDASCPPSKQQKWKKRYAHGTKGKPAPLGRPIIVGDPQADGKVNPEIVLATKRGVHVQPIKDLPGYNEGTGTLKRRTPRVDGRTVPTKPAVNPSAKVDRGLDAHYRTSMVKSLDRMKRYAYGTGQIGPKSFIRPTWTGPVDAIAESQRRRPLPAMDGTSRIAMA
jgi:hypothetical protein